MVAAISLSATAALSACQSNSSNDAGAKLTGQIPKITVEGTRAREYASLDELAADATAVVIARPTGEEFARPLPKDYGPDDAAPTPYVRMRVTRVLSGDVKPGVIDLVSPGIDGNTREQALKAGGPYLLYITPAMYGPNQPAGGYVVVSGPAGTFASSSGNDEDFVRVDDESAKLPDQVKVGKSRIPAAALSNAEALRIGPR